MSAKVIAVSTAKGGAGKTTSSILLIRYLVEEMGKKVLAIDLDARGGLTGLLTAVGTLPKGSNSVATFLMVTHEQGNVGDAFRSAILKSPLNENKHWRKNNGELHVLPANTDLDAALSLISMPFILRRAIMTLRLPDEYVVVIDTGPDKVNVGFGIVAADIVFIPAMFSPQETRPAIETIRTIVLAQQEFPGRAVFGGMLINQVEETNWEGDYRDQMNEILGKFKEKADFDIAGGLSTDTFIHIPFSRLLRRGDWIEWAAKDRFVNVGHQMAQKFISIM